MNLICDPGSIHSIVVDNGCGEEREYLKGKINLQSVN